MRDRLIIGALLAMAWCAGLWAQSAPTFNGHAGLQQGDVPQAIDWNDFFEQKADAFDGILTNPTIMGGTIDGATIGGTTPGAGTFTTLAGGTIGASTSVTTPKLIGATGGALTITPDVCGDTVQFKGSPSGSAVLMSLTGSCLGSGSVTIGAYGGTSVSLQNVSSLLMQQGTPSSSSASCTAGQVEADQNYLYECVLSNTWKRVALASF